MPRFQSKPRMITAEQYRHPSMQPQGVCFCADGCPVASEDPSESQAHVHTMHGDQAVMLEEGDWIVPEPDGIHYYPIKDEVMKANWELVKVEQCYRCRRVFPIEVLALAACEGLFCIECLEVIETRGETEHANTQGK